MRLFIGLWPSEEMKKDIISVMHEMKKQGTLGSFTPASNLHLTLAFLGEVKEVEVVKEVLSSLPPEKSRLTFGEYGGNQDVFWITVKANQKLKKYVADLRKALSEKGIPVDTKKFEPHMTLLRHPKGKPSKGLPIPSSDMTVSKVSLIKSEVKDGKRVYKEIYSVSV